MTPDKIQELLQPFADVATLVERGFAGIPKRGEEFLRKTFSVNGMEQTVVLTVEDFFKLRDLHAQVGEFVTQKSQSPQPNPAEVQKSSGAGGTTEATTLGDAAAADVQKPGA